MKNIKIRKAKLKDLDLLMEFQRKLVDEEMRITRKLEIKKPLAYPESEVREIILSKNSCAFVAEHNGKPIGCGFVRLEKLADYWYKHQKAGYLGMLFVEKPYRRKGIAAKLQDERMRWLRSKGIRLCFNTILSGNEPSMKMQKKRGFKPYSMKMYKMIK